MWPTSGLPRLAQGSRCGGQEPGESTEQFRRFPFAHELRNIRRDIGRQGSVLLVRCCGLWVSIWIEVANDGVEGTRENKLNGSEDNLQVGWSPRQEHRYYQRYQDRDESIYDDKEQYSSKANPLPDFQ